MKKNHTIAIAAAFLAPLLVNGGAQAITDNVFRYSSPKTGHLQIPAAAFGVTHSDTGFDKSAILFSPSDDVDTCFAAAVNLPDRARMTDLAVWYVKGNGTDFTVQLFAQKMTDGSVSSPVGGQLADNGGARTRANFNITTGQVVDNQNHNYTIQVCTNARNNEFYGARVTYTYVTAGD